jgi:hypothetical protein
MNLKRSIELIVPTHSITTKLTAVITGRSFEIEQKWMSIETPANDDSKIIPFLIFPKKKGKQSVGIELFQNAGRIFSSKFEITVKK